MKALRCILWAFFCFPVKGSPSKEDCQNPCIGEKTCQVQKSADTCYYLFPDEELTWNESREFCKSQGLSMAQGNEDDIKQNITIHLVKGKKNKFVWLGGVTYNLTKWSFDTGDPQHGNRSDQTTDLQDGKRMDQCGTLHITSTNLKFNNTRESCSHTHEFICRLDDYHNTPNVYISDRSATWSEAESICSGLQGDLFRLKPRDNSQYLENKLLSLPGKTFFVGLNRISWEWEDGSEILYYNWLPGEPKSSSGKCLMMYSQTAKWKANDCNGKALTFCQNGSDSGTENSKEDKPMEALYNTIATIFTLGGLLGVSAAINICLIVCIIVCLTNSSTRQPDDSDDHIYHDVIYQPDLVAVQYLAHSATMAIAAQRDAVMADFDSNISDETEIVDNACYGTQMKRGESNQEISDEMEIQDNPVYA